MPRGAVRDSFFDPKVQILEVKAPFLADAEGWQVIASKQPVNGDLADVQVFRHLRNRQDP